MSTIPTTSEASADVTGRLEDASKARVFSVLAIIVLFTEIAPLQYTMVTAALRQIGPSFPGTGANLNWAIIIFGLIGAAVSPLIGKMSDLWGKKLMFLVCGGCFLVGCAISALTHSWGLFLVGRGLQAVAIATAVIAYGLVRDLMPRRYVPLGIGVTATGLGFSALVAPLLGGYMVQHYSWRAIFWFLFVFTLVMTPLVVAFVPESRLRVKERLDIVGALLLGAGVGGCLLYLDKGQDWGWGKPATLAWLVGGLVLLALFVLVEVRAANPIMDMKLLFAPRVSMVLFIALFASLGIGVQNYATAYMTQVPKADDLAKQVSAQATQAVQAQTHQPLPPNLLHVAIAPRYTYGQGFTLLSYGVHLAIWAALAAMIFGAVTGHWTRRIGGRLPLIGALVLMAIGSLGYVFRHSTWPEFLILGVVFGVGFGAYFAAAPNLIVEAVPQEQQGVSAGMLGVMNSMGTAIGLAIVTAFLTANPVKATVTLPVIAPTTRTVPQIFADHGYVLGFLVVGLAALIGLVATILMRDGRAPATGGLSH